MIRKTKTPSAATAPAKPAKPAKAAKAATQPRRKAAAPATPTAAPMPATEPDNGLAAKGTREGTKQAALIAMLRSPDGATIAEIVAATGWLPHTARGAIAGALKKRLGLTVTSDKVEGRGRVYRITG